MEKIVALLLALTGLCVVNGDGFHQLSNKELIDELERLLQDTLFKRMESAYQYDEYDASSKCEDKIPDAGLCKSWKRVGSCESYKHEMRKFCAKTCDLCRPPAPPIPVLPACASTDFGCCWDNNTVAKGPTDDLQLSGCPPCLNRRSKSFCSRFSDLCMSRINGQGDIMRYECPQTCGVPCDHSLNVNAPLCGDLEGYESDCIQWFQEGKCQSRREAMAKICRKSCGLCPKVGV